MEAENFITATGYAGTTVFIELKWCSKLIGFAYEYTYRDIIRTMNTKHIGTHSGCNHTLYIQVFLGFSYSRPHTRSHSVVLSTFCDHVA